MPRYFFFAFCTPELRFFSNRFFRWENFVAGARTAFFVLREDRFPLPIAPSLSPLHNRLLARLGISPDGNRD